MTTSDRDQETGTVMTTDSVIDMHTHIWSLEAMQVASDYEHHDPVGVSETPPESGAVNSDMFAAVFDRLTDPAARLQDMDRFGVARQLLSASPPQFYYWLPAEPGLTASRTINDEIARWVAARPDRFSGLATLPMQSPSLACAELQRIAELGFVGVQLSTHVTGQDLDHPDLRPVLEDAAALGLPIVLHPDGTTCGARLNTDYLTNVIGNPLDTTIAAMRLVLAGVLEELPDLQLVLVHAGGYLPAGFGRARHAQQVRPEVGASLPRPVGDYLRQVHLDSITHDDELLQHLIDAGYQVMVGSDYPFDMGVEDPAAVLERLNLTEVQRQDLRANHALELFKLPAGAASPPRASVDR